MAFAERFEKEMKMAEVAILMDVVNGGFSFDYKIPYQNCGIRRMRDTILEDGRLKTEYFCFPQNGQKNKLKMGVVMTLLMDIDSTNKVKAVFSNPSILEIHRANMTDIYYAVAAVKGGRLLEQEGVNTYLNHDVMVLTPEKETVPLEGFDFASHELFMLGLFGGDYKIGIKEKA